MAPFTADSDKTEEPTPHRLREARRKGQVFKSTELNAAANVLGVMLVLVTIGSWWLKQFQKIFSTLCGQLASPGDTFHSQAVLSFGATGYLTIMAPVFITAIVIALAANLTQVGFLFTLDHITPQLSRINPAQGLKRIFSRRSLFEMVKAIAKILIVGMVTFVYLRNRLPEALMLLNQETSYSARLLWGTISGLGLRVGFLFAALAVLDYLFQRREHFKSLWMTRKEVKEEMKHLEGDPLVRSKIRERQQLLAQQRMLHEVPTADVIVTNPTAIAVALRYLQEKDNAPRVVAKGKGRIAGRIREIADEHEILLVENPPVAQMLFEHTDIGDEIPVELYQAVAEILAMVYRLRGKNRL